MAVGGQGRNNFSDVAHEAHVKHAVGFVQHQDFNRTESQPALVHKVEQPSRSGDHDVNAALQSIGLSLLADTAEDCGMAQMKVNRVRAEFFTDLDREFAGGRQDQGARAPPVFLAVSARKTFENGKGEGRGLAGAGLGDTQQILAVQQLGNGACLDRCRLDVVSGGQRTLYGFGQVEA